jgi:hypothetical protein
MQVANVPNEIRRLVDAIAARPECALVVISQNFSRKLGTPLRFVHSTQSKYLAAHIGSMTECDALGLVLAEDGPTPPDNYTQLECGGDE